MAKGIRVAHNAALLAVLAVLLPAGTTGTAPGMAVARPPVANPARVAAEVGSILWVGGCPTSSCDPHQPQTEGSGWVVSPQRVVTNAHVVAGMRTAVVRVGREGTPYPAIVVLFDPKRDLAILSVPGLRAPALPQGQPLTIGDRPIVAGYAWPDPYRALPAVVTARRSITINDGRAEGRDTYTLTGYADHGSSGGPLLDSAGNVVGIVYAGDPDRAVVDALTLTEARPVLNAAAAATTPVSTH